jgi:hypothetical protein
MFRWPVLLFVSPKRIASFRDLNQVRSVRITAQSPLYDCEALAETLLRTRCQPADAPAVSGVYAAFMRNPHSLPDIEVGPSGLLFVGLSKSDLRSRIRFTHRQGGFSTLRRSIGAILKEQLGLRAIPLASATSSDYRHHHYQFVDEARLDLWMNSYLTYGYSTIERHVRNTEKTLIKHLRPPLNLIGWENPQAEKVKALREICRQEAWGILLP